MNKQAPLLKDSGMPRGVPVLLSFQSQADKLKATESLIQINFISRHGASTKLLSLLISNRLESKRAWIIIFLFERGRAVTWWDGEQLAADRCPRALARSLPVTAWHRGRITTPAWHCVPDL